MVLEIHDIAHSFGDRTALDAVSFDIAGVQVTHFGRLHGLSRRDATSKAHALLAELGLEDRWNDRTDKLSGGMQQRLQLATSLRTTPWSSSWTSRSQAWTH